MSRIEKQLMSGETVIKRAHIHWIVYLPAMAVATVAAVAGGWLGSQPQTRTAGEMIGGALGVCALYLDLLGLIKRSSARFIVTNKRFLISFGLVRQRSSEILLSQIEGITVQQGFWGRIFNYGTVVVEGTGGDEAPSLEIAGPEAFRLAVQEQIERYTGGSRSQPGEATPRQGTRYDELLKLDELRGKGVLTEEEFQREKRRLLGSADEGPQGKT